MTNPAEKMIDVGQSSNATKVEAAIPSKKLSKKKSSKKIPSSVRINLLMKEEAASFKGGIEEEAINERMKVLELKRKPEKSVTAAEGDITAVARKIALSGPRPSGFRAEIRGFDTGADDVEVCMALGKHFESCGEINQMDVCVSEGYAHIDFARLDSLYKALEVKNARVGDHLVTVKKAFAYPIRVEIRGFDTRAGAEEVGKALRKRFGKCGRIEEISVNDGCAYIDFASIDSLNKALKLNNTSVGGRRVAVMHPRVNIRTTILSSGIFRSTSRFRALVSWSNVHVIDLEPVFEKCGEISGIHYDPRDMLAFVEFTNFDSLEKALKLDNTKVGNHTITVIRRFAGGALRPGAPLGPEMDNDS